ncbi:MAG TPA: diacylglycerol kinase family protein [Actinomycetota bacterium]|nr:diacylglycerol kinase family protein [Actinomycetota bacterium]
MTRARPSAVLVVNPNAGRISPSVHDEVVAALRTRFQLEAFSTTARDTGIELAAQAVRAGARLVIAFGGDGHVNEVVNGVAGTDATLGLIPGGTMNVFARALGIPLDPFKAVDHLHERVDSEPRRVPLGLMGDRYFTFSAGCGFDAEAAERVERYVPQKRRFGELFFYWSAFRVLAGSAVVRSPTMTLKGDFGEVDVAMAIASNAGPYAYLGNRPIRIAPNVNLERGIDVFALKTMRVEALPVYAWRCLVSGDLVNHPDAFYANDLDWFEIHSDRPFGRHVDGEPLSRARSARFSVAPGVLKVHA